MGESLLLVTDVMSKSHKERSLSLMVKVYNDMPLFFSNISEIIEKNSRREKQFLFVRFFFVN